MLGAAYGAAGGTGGGDIGGVQTAGSFKLAVGVCDDGVEAGGDAGGDAGGPGGGAGDCDPIVFLIVFCTLPTPPRC